MKPFQKENTFFLIVPAKIKIGTYYVEKFSIRPRLIFENNLAENATCDQAKWKDTRTL